MGKVDIAKATRPERHLRDGSNSPRARHFAEKLTPTAKRHIFIRRQILFERREPPVNPERTETEDPKASARLVKAPGRGRLGGRRFPSPHPRSD